MAEPVADKVAAQVEAVTSNPPPASVTETVTATATATETAASPAAPAANAAQTASQSAPSVVQATAAAVTQAAAQTVSAAASTAAAAVTAAAATAASSIASAAITAASAAASGSSAASQAVIDAVSAAASQDSAPADVQSFGELLVQLVASLEEVSTSAESVVGKDVFAVLGLGDARRGGLVLLMLLGLLFFVVVSFIVRSATRVVIPKKGHAVLLLGDTNSGKTALFFKLQQGDFRDTVPSAKENAGKFIPIGLEFEASQKSVADNLEFVDFPGHGSLRTRLAEVLPKARAIVFVVDSTVGTPVVTTPGEAPTAPFPGLHPSAEYLYSLLTNKSVVSRKIPIMIACSKVDLDNKLSSSRISSELNKMLNNMRNIKHNLADISGGASKDTVPLPMAQGQEKFVLEKNPACPVTFGEISSKDDNIREIMYFLQESLL